MRRFQTPRKAQPQVAGKVKLARHNSLMSLVAITAPLNGELKTLGSDPSVLLVMRDLALLDMSYVQEAFRGSTTGVSDQQGE